MDGQGLIDIEVTGNPIAIKQRQAVSIESKTNRGKKITQYKITITHTTRVRCVCQVYSTSTTDFNRECKVGSAKAPPE